MQSYSESSKANGAEIYETNLGFSKPNSKYIGAQVIYSKAEPDQEDENKRSNQISADTIPPKLKLRQLSYIFILGISAVVIAAGILLFYRFNFGKSSAYTFQAENSIEVYSDSEKLTTYVFNTSGEVLDTINSDRSILYTPDHKAAVLAGYVNAYYVNAYEQVSLNRKLNLCNISDNGQYILYSSKLGQVKEALYLYDVANGTEELINKIDGKYYGLLNLSPDGKTISYSTITVTEPVIIETFTKKAGEDPVSAGMNTAILAVSNDAGYLYYCEFDTEENGVKSLYVRKKDTVTKLADSFDISRVWFNQDYSEIMFTSDGKTYVSANGNEKQLVADKIVTQLITPKNCIFHFNINNVGMLYGISSFKNKVIRCEDGSIIFTGKHYSSKEIAPPTDQQYNYISYLSDGGNDLMFSTGDSSVMKVSDLKGGCRKDTYIEHADSFVPTNDLSKVYYTDHNYLYFLNEKGKAVKVTDNVLNIFLNADGDTAFLFKDYKNGSGTLYYCIDGGEPQNVPGGMNVSQVLEWNQGIIYQKTVDGKYNTYYSTQGTEFKQLLDGVRFFINPSERFQVYD
jgi:hypothetical protein